MSARNRSTTPPTGAATSPLAMPCYAGTSVDHLREIKAAADVVRELTSLLA